MDHRRGVVRLLPGARFAPFAPPNSRSPWQHDTSPPVVTGHRESGIQPLTIHLQAGSPEFVRRLRLSRGCIPCPCRHPSSRRRLYATDARSRHWVSFLIFPTHPWNWHRPRLLCVAARRANHEVVKTLLAAGAPVNASDSRGRTPLQLAVRACIDSYWKYRRKPDSVVALLAAGATIDGIDLPTGYDAIDELLL